MVQAIEFIGDGEDDSLECNPEVYHLPGCDSMSDYTFCGITLDGDELTAGSFRIVNALAINCPTCVAMIKHAKGKRIQE